MQSLWNRHAWYLSCICCAKRWWIERWTKQLIWHVLWSKIIIEVTWAWQKPKMQHQLFFREEKVFCGCFFFPSLLVIRNLLQFFWKRCRETWYMAAHIFILNPNLIDLQQNSFIVTGESNKQVKRRKGQMYKKRT